MDAVSTSMQLGSPTNSNYRGDTSRDYSFHSMTPGTGDQNFKRRGAESPQSTIGNDSENQEEILERTKRLIDQLDAGLKLSHDKMRPFEVS